MDTAISAIHRPPMYYEARAHCDRFDISDVDEFEKVRLALCHQEFKRRAEPWIKMLVKLDMFDLPGTTKTAERIEAERQVHEVLIREAQSLGMDLSPLPDDYFGQDSMNCRKSFTCRSQRSASSL